MRPIDADAALKALRKCQTYLYDARDPELKIELSSAEAAINNLPTIQPEKAQLSSEGTTSDLISRQAAIDALDCINGTEEVLRSLPSAQPEYEEVTPEEATSEIASRSIMSAWSWFNVMIQLKQMGYAICRKK